MTGRRSFRLLAALLLAVALRQPASSAEFVEIYKAGIAAAETMDWPRAADMMQRAIELQPEAKPRVKRAFFFKRYIPYYHLGRARFELGDCAGALSAWAESREQEIVIRSSEYEDLQAGEAACKSQLSDLERALVEAKEGVMAAGAAAVRARERLADLQTLGRGSAGSLANRLQAAETALRGAEELLRQGGDDAADLTLAAVQASEAREGFDSVAREASQWMASIATEQVQLRQQLLELSIEGRALIRSSDSLHPLPSGVAAKRSRLASLIADVAGLEDEVPTAELIDLSKSLSEAMRELEMAIAEPPTALVIAVEAFLKGQYAEALEALPAIENASDRIAEQVHLLRAATLFSLHFSQAVQRSELLDEARREVLLYKARRLDPTQPSEKIFSPRFIAFFERTMFEADPVESSGESG